MNKNSSLDHFKTLHAMYVEDDAVIRENIAASLEYFFSKVSTADSYDEALRLYHNENIDMLFVDIEMPGKSGIELVKTIRIRDQKTPIIMMTAYTDKKNLLKLVNLNIQHYLVKPITLSKLKSTLHTTPPYFDSVLFR